VENDGCRKHLKQTIYILEELNVLFSENGIYCSGACKGT